MMSRHIIGCKQETQILAAKNNKNYVNFFADKKKDVPLHQEIDKTYDSLAKYILVVAQILY